MRELIKILEAHHAFSVKSGNLERIKSAHYCLTKANRILKDDVYRNMLSRLVNQLGNEHVSEEFCEPIIEEAQKLLNHE